MILIMQTIYYGTGSPGFCQNLQGIPRFFMRGAEKAG